MQLQETFNKYSLEQRLPHNAQKIDAYFNIPKNVIGINLLIKNPSYNNIPPPIHCTILIANTLPPLYNKKHSLPLIDGIEKNIPLMFDYIPQPNASAHLILETNKECNNIFDSVGDILLPIVQPTVKLFIDDKAQPHGIGLSIEFIYNNKDATNGS